MRPPVWYFSKEFTNVSFCNTLISMKFKNNLKTLRLSASENQAILRYLETHPYIKTFSTLVRAAVWDYLQKAADAPPSERPSFLWDYDLSHGQIVEILRGPQKNRLWLVAKILEHAKWEELWRYLTVRQIERDLPLLRLPEKTRAHWDYALRHWKRAAHA